MRLAFLVPLALLAAACGSAHISQRGPAPRTGPHGPPPSPDEASVEGANAKLDGRVVTWRIEHAGPFALFTRGLGKDASYVGCAVLR